MQYDLSDIARARDLAIIILNTDKSPFQKINKEDYKRLPDQKIIEHRGGWGLLCGERSDNIEAIDIDLKYDISGDIHKRYWQEVESISPGLIDRLVIHKTKSGGFHILYRCVYVEGNKKLARRNATVSELSKEPAKTRVLIETRGDGGYVVIPPTEGYDVIRGSLLDVPVITTEERDVLWGCARLFNELSEVDVRQQLSEDRKKYRYSTDKTDNPFEDFNMRGDLIALLEKWGWKVTRRKSSKALVQRPGETSNRWSADVDDFNGIQLLYVYTTSTEFESEKAYTPAHVFCILECQGNWSEAAKKLKDLGYGQDKKKDIRDTEFIESPVEEIDEDLDKKRITSETEVPPIYELIKINGGLVLSRGNVITISGPIKVGKSAIVNAILSKALNPDSVGFDSIEVRPNRNGLPVIQIDTEQSLAKHKQNIMRWIIPRTGFEDTPPYFYSYNFREYTVRKAREALVRLLQRVYSKHKGIFLIVIDGISEFVRSPNDEEGSYTIVKMLMEMSAAYDTGIINILHTNPSFDDRKKERGHLGSELQRKSESILRIDSDDYDKEVRILRPVWLRNADVHNVEEVIFKYDIEKHRHEQVASKKVDSEYENLRSMALTIRNHMPESEALTMIMNKRNVATSRAQAILNSMKKLRMIEKVDGYLHRVDGVLNDNGTEEDGETDDLPF